MQKKINFNKQVLRELFCGHVDPHSSEGKLKIGYLTNIWISAKSV